MKQVYFYDKDTKEFAGYDVIDDTAEIPANATTVEPVDDSGVGLYDPTWNENTNSWDSLTEEEWKQKHATPEVKPEPTQDQQTAAQQMLLMADLQNKVDTLTDTVDEMTKSNQQINAALAQIMLQNATNAENGGK
ncbi:hypothetical protein LSCP400_21261 [Ligilactobacillus salivarius cp400]|uniref:Uncharacterized protein n=1 Tax=Ligilactobacillus salivarius cp400 TaxID=1273133 RepID=V6DNC7_9LACO|nr:hypothetical protein LSCP400_21261 [Ligilactobacillus salivarius cp400]